MILEARFLHDRLAEFESVAGTPGRYIVAFSGGIDSTVLLHALVAAGIRPAAPVVAAHVDHGLQAESPRWEAECRSLARSFGVEYVSQKVEIGRDGNAGLEAAARDARYAYLGSLMQPHDWLLSAHHENDQAETLLLGMLRGSGLTGLAGMGPVREFSSGFLVRPMLGVPIDAIRQYAERNGLRWSDDPSNTDTVFDRNYLRQKIMPLLAARWPAAAARLRQSAELAAESSQLLAELADIDIASSPSARRLDIRLLAGLSRPRQRNLIRHAVRRCGLAPPPATRLYQAVHELVPARQDAQPLVAWPGGELRRYRDKLYILAPLPDSLPEAVAIITPDTAVNLGAGMGRLLLRQRGAAGIDPRVADQGLAIHYRRGGEEILLPQQAHRRKLKKLLQEEGIVPWMRERIPLLYAGEKLVAVADLWVDQAFVSSDGYLPGWLDKPELY